VKPPKPAKVALLAIPGGSILLDGKEVGQDVTKVLRLSAGEHTVQVRNRFAGDHSAKIRLSPGQTGIVEIVW